MVEFCKNCGGMMLPSKDKTEKNLICNLCGQKIHLDDEIVKSYTYIKETPHPKGEEFKNLEEMKHWRKSKKSNIPSQ